MSFLDRRRFLHGTGIALGLPLLESLAPRSASASETGAAPSYSPDGTPRRMVCICNKLGLHFPDYVPDGTGREWKPSPYLKRLESYRDNMTVLSGVFHPEVDGGHPAEKSFLTCAPASGRQQFKKHDLAGPIRRRLRRSRYAFSLAGDQRQRQQQSVMDAGGCRFPVRRVLPNCSPSCSSRGPRTRSPVKFASCVMARASWIRSWTKPTRCSVIYPAMTALSLTNTSALFAMLNTNCCVNRNGRPNPNPRSPRSHLRTTKTLRTLPDDCS